MPNWRVHLDLFGPLKQSGRKKKMILVITDAFTKMAEVVPIEDKQADTVAMAFFGQWICRHGCPRQIITDGGKEFCSKLTEQLLKYLEIDHVVTTAYHPQSNSGAESFNREIIRYLSCMMKNADEDWEAWLPSLMMAYNTRIHKATNRSPFYLTYLREPNLPYFMLEMDRKMYGEDWATSAAHRMKILYQMTRKGLLKAAEVNKKYYDRNAKQQETFAAGETVMVHYPKTSFGKENLKFVRPWVKYEVVRPLGHESYEVRKWGDASKKYTSRVHVNRMKRYYKPIHTLPSDKRSNLQIPEEDVQDQTGEEWASLPNDAPQALAQPQQGQQVPQGQQDAEMPQEEEAEPQEMQQYIPRVPQPGTQPRRADERAENPDEREKITQPPRGHHQEIPPLPIARATRSHHPDLVGQGDLPKKPLEYQRDD